MKDGKIKKILSNSSKLDSIELSKMIWIKIKLLLGWLLYYFLY